MAATMPSTVRLVYSETRRPGEEQASSVDLSAAGALAPIGQDADSTDRHLLYAEFAPLVRRLIRQYGQNADMREDLAGEIYCRFCALLDVFDPERGVPLRPYLVRQLTLATYTYARQQWRIQKREATWEIEEVRAEQKDAFDPTVDWLTALARDQAAALLPPAMQKLPVRQRNVVIWRYYEEHSFEEIAALLGVQPGTARSLLRHGLNNLRRAIGSADCY